VILPALLGLAAAQPRLLPDRAVVLPPCEADELAACWSDVPTLIRFAPPEGLTAAAVTAQVRLSWADGVLLIFAEDLPSGGRIEVSLGEPGGTNPTWSVTAGEGLSTHPLDADAGQLRPMWLHLRTPDGDGVLLRPWSLTGAGDSQHAFPVLLADAPTLGFPAEATEDFAVVPGADQVTLTRQQVEIPRNSRGVPPPWSATDSGGISLIVPHTGWYRLEAAWQDGGQLIDVAAWRIYLEAEPAGLSVAGIFPVPDVHAPLPGEGLTLTDRTAVCAPASWEPVATLLLAEVARLTGRTLTTRRRCRSGDIQLEDATVGPTPDAFSLTISEGAVVTAGDLRGATYGVLALVDALGDNGQIEAMEIHDAPDIADRILYHQLNLSSRGPMPVAQWIDFLHQVVLRGRYNQIYLNLLDSYRFESHPELAARNALTPEQLQEMLAAARTLGVAVFPAISAPGHATWITRAHPELASGGNPGVLCPRNPAVYPLLSEVYTELLEAFDSPRRVHIGHDETYWDPQRQFGDERDPRCTGTPAWVLFADDLRWHVDFFADHDAEVIAWSDMLVAGWNGGREDTWRAADSEALQASLTVAAWSKVGDSQGVLGELGYPIIRLHTGYHDWKRSDLDPSTIAGEGLALFHPFPWMAAGVNPGTQALRFYWSQVLLAGATAWRADLSEVPINEILLAITDLPAMRPGWQHPAGWSGAVSPLLLTGTAPDATVPEVAWPTHIDIAGVRFSSLRPTLIAPEQPARITVDRQVAGLSILTAAVLDRSVRQVVVSQTRSPDTAPAIAHLTVTWADGESETVPIRLGLETFDLLGDPRARSLWGSPGASVPSPEAAQSAGTGHDRQVYRLDWHNPRPDVAVRTTEITAADGGRLLLVGAASLDQ
jgi:hypothetical protein